MKSNNLYPCFTILSSYLVPIDSRLIKIEILKAINLAMVKIVETDERITLEKQLDEAVGPILEMNKFNVDPDEVDEFLRVFAKTTETFKQQSRTAVSRHCRQHDIRYLYRLGICSTF